MRKGRRIATRVIGFAVFASLSLLVLLQTDSISEITNKNNLFAQKEQAPVIEKAVEQPAVTLDSTTIEKNAGDSGKVLASGAMFWDESYYDLSCFRQASVNYCRRSAAGNDILLVNLLFSKQHHGLQFFDGTSTVINLTAEEIVGYNANGKPKYEKVDEAQYRYCTGEKYESLAMISFGPISWPTTLMGQEISTYRVTGDDSEEIQYAVIDPTNRLFKDFEPDDIINFCNASDTDASYALRTLDTWNAKVAGYNAGDQMGYGILALCKLAGVGGEARDKMIEDLWKSEDQDIDSVTVRVEVENNLGMVDEKFHDEIQKDGLLNGLAPEGPDYLGMYAWQTRGARYARVSNTTAASKLLSNLVMAPNKTIDFTNLKENRDVPDDRGRSSTIINGIIDKTFLRQMESSKATVVGALSGGVYYMSEKVLNNSNNLATLSWDPTKQDVSTYFCKIKGNLKRCPVVRSIGGCSSSGFAQTDVRLRQLTLSAVNDTQQWARETEEDMIARTTSRTEHILQERLQAPDDLIERATTDEIITATQRGTAVCLPQVQERVAAQASKLSEKEMEQLATRMERPNYKDQAVLVSPVKTQYRAWALYDVNKDEVAACKAQLAAWKRRGYKVSGNCNVDPDNNGWNAVPVEKWDGDDHIIRPALISFNIATYYRGLETMSPTDLRLVNFKEDLKTQLASQEIYEYPGVKVDCGPDANGAFQYWLCTESDYKLLPKCSDGSGSSGPQQEP